jgi:hypothetical protein
MMIVRMVAMTLVERRLHDSLTSIIRKEEKDEASLRLL